MGVTGLICVLLMMQPDLGQTILFSSIWLALMMVSGVPAARLWSSAIGAVVGIVARL